MSEFSETSTWRCGKKIIGKRCGYQRQTICISIYTSIWRHLDAGELENLFARSQLITIERSAAWVLCAEDHLRVMCVDWLNDGGAEREKLWEIYYAVARRLPDFDWASLDAAGAKRRKWMICTLGAAENISDSI